MKERRNLAILLLLLAAMLAAFFSIREIRKISRQKMPEDVQTVLTKVTAENLSAISYIYDKNQITFLYDNGNWVYVEDPKMPLNPDIPNRMQDIVTNLASIRTVAKYTDKADYGINDSSIQVVVKGKDGSSYGFAIGSYVGFSDGYYIMINGDENIYFVPGDIRQPFSYHGSDLVDMYPIPEISKVNYLCVETSEECFEVFLDVNSDEWYSLVNGEKVTLDRVNARSTAGMVSRLKWAGCADYYAEEDEMDQYGLDKPTTITANYSGIDNVPRSFTLCIGLATGSKYYARVPGSQMVMLIQEDFVSPFLGASLDKLRA